MRAGPARGKAGMRRRACAGWRARARGRTFAAASPSAHAGCSLRDDRPTDRPRPARTRRRAPAAHGVRLLRQRRGGRAHARRQRGGLGARAAAAALSRRRLHARPLHDGPRPARVDAGARRADRVPAHGAPRRRARHRARRRGDGHRHDAQHARHDDARGRGRGVRRGARRDGRALVPAVRLSRPRRHARAGGARGGRRLRRARAHGRCALPRPAPARRAQRLRAASGALGREPRRARQGRGRRDARRLGARGVRRRDARSVAHLARRRVAALHHAAARDREGRRARRTPPST